MALKDRTPCLFNVDLAFGVQLASTGDHSHLATYGKKALHQLRFGERNIKQELSLKKGRCIWVVGCILEGKEQKKKLEGSR